MSRSPAPAAPCPLRIIHRSPSPTTVIYPVDYNGNYCGKPGTSVEKLPYAHFAKLDQDINDQRAVLTKNQWWNFVPYTICVDECPEKFSIVDNATYGGCDYPGAEKGSGECDPDKNTFFAAFKTKQMLKRCFPIIENADAASRTLCAVPACNGVLGNDGVIDNSGADRPCIEVPGEPEAGKGTPSGSMWLARLAGHL